MQHINKLYENYVAKCKQFKIKPSPKKVIFADMIAQHEKEIRLSIPVNKKAVPVLSDTAKQALIKPEKKKTKSKTKAARPKKHKVMSDQQRADSKIKSERIYYHKNKVLKPKLELTSDEIEQKQILKKQRSKEYYQKNKERINQNYRDTYVPHPTKPLTDEEKQARKVKRDAYHKQWYKENKERLKQMALTRKENGKTIPLTQEEIDHKEAQKKAYAKTYREKNKAKLNAQTKAWRDAKDPDQRRSDMRNYRTNNLEKIREQDRNRQEQRKKFYKNNPEALKNRREKDRERYAKKMNDPEYAAKMKAKWKKDGAKKRIKKNEQK